MKFKPHHIIISKISGLAYKVLNTQSPHNVRIVNTGEWAYLLRRFPLNDEGQAGNVYVLPAPHTDENYVLFTGDVSYLESVEGVLRVKDEVLMLESPVDNPPESA